MTPHSYPRRSPADAPRYRNRPELTELQMLRLARGLQQNEIAQATGTDDSAVSLWETFAREPRHEHRVSYSRALGISVGELGRIIYQHAKPQPARRSRSRGGR